MVRRGDSPLIRAGIAAQREHSLWDAGYARHPLPADELLGRKPDPKARRAYLAGIPVGFTASDLSMVYQSRHDGLWRVLKGTQLLRRRQEYGFGPACTYATKRAALAAARRA